jgi:hypothetical protein
MTCPHARKQKTCGKQNRYELHVPPWFEQTDLIALRDARNSKKVSFEFVALSGHPSGKLVGSGLGKGPV